MTLRDMKGKMKDAARVVGNTAASVNRLARDDGRVARCRGILLGRLRHVFHEREGGGLGDVAHVELAHEATGLLITTENVG